jgi:hypothetical protein
MAMLVRSGLPSRNAAKRAVEATAPTFLDRAELRLWLISEPVVTLSLDPEWPSLDTASIWNRFRLGLVQQTSAAWSMQTTSATLADDIEFTGLLRIDFSDPTRTYATTADYKRRSRVLEIIEPLQCGVSYARKYEDGRFEVIQIGPN